MPLSNDIYRMLLINFMYVIYNCQLIALIECLVRNVFGDHDTIESESNTNIYNSEQARTSLQRMSTSILSRRTASVMSFIDVPEVTLCEKKHISPTTNQSGDDLERKSIPR